MFELYEINTAAAAFTAGLVTSIHCVGMCGPLAVVLNPRPDDKIGIQTINTVYHVTRICAYGLIGALAGAIGRAPAEWLMGSPVRYAPWALVAFFLIIGFGLDKWLPKPKALTHFFHKLTWRLARIPKLYAGVLLGLCTPFLPCGPLYMIFALAMIMGSPARGAEFLLAFGVGTMPLLWLVHSQYVFLNRKLSPRVMSWLQRGVAISAALVIGWRLLAFSMSDPNAPGMFCH